ncbi:hypothetical protein [Nocardioides sp. 616]|uniref:hypothetical protein n=1 Tax=Nocardioides sp. 616 TaxID=2268090 RepID=UPI000CE47446|nr:hypothetical protein [Nocardioides sp. 616]
MNLFALSLASYGRHLRGALGVPRAGLMAIGAVVFLLCLSATGLSVAAVLSMELGAADPGQLALLRDDFGRGLVFLAMCGGVFVAATTVPGTAFRVLLRGTGGSRRDRYLLLGAIRDVLCVVVPLMLCAVAYVPLATLLRESIGLVPGLLLGAGAAILVCLGSSGLVECARTALRVLRPGVPEAFATAAACAFVLATGLALAPLSLLPWDAVVPWSLFTEEGRIDGPHGGGLLVFLLLVSGVWLACFSLSATSERMTPVLQGPTSFSIVRVGGRGPVTTLISLFTAATLRVPTVLALVAFAWIFAGLAHSAGTELGAALALIAAAGLAGSIGLRAHGAELPARWLVLPLAPSSRSVAWTLPMGSLLVCLLGVLPAMLSAWAIFDVRAGGYFAVTALTTYAFTLFAGTLVPVSAEEPLSAVTAGAVSFALSGGVVGLIESGLADRSEAVAALTAVTVAAAAVSMSVLVAWRRYERSVLP